MTSQQLIGAIRRIALQNPCDPRQFHVRPDQQVHVIRKDHPCFQIVESQDFFSVQERVLNKLCNSRLFQPERSCLLAVKRFVQLYEALAGSSRRERLDPPRQGPIQPPSHKKDRTSWMPMRKPPATIEDFHRQNIQQEQA